MFYHSRYDKILKFGLQFILAHNLNNWETKTIIAFFGGIKISRIKFTEPIKMKQSRNRYWVVENQTCPEQKIKKSNKPRLTHIIFQQEIQKGPNFSIKSQPRTRKIQPLHPKSTKANNATATAQNTNLQRRV